MEEGKSDAITLLVDHIHSIPVRLPFCTMGIITEDNGLVQIGRVVQQLQNRPYYLFLYLDALVGKDPHLVSDFADLQVRPLPLTPLPHTNRLFR